MRISDWSSDVCSSDLTHDLVGAFQNGMDPQVAPEAFDWIILKIAIASMKLKRTVDHRRPSVRCEPLGHGGETDLAGGIVWYLDDSGVQQGAGGLKLGFHVSQRELECLEFRNRLTELIAVAGILERLVQKTGTAHVCTAATNAQ